VKKMGCPPEPALAEAGAGMTVFIEKQDLKKCRHPCADGDPIWFFSFVTQVD
jgi:hypothetical protein